MTDSVQHIERYRLSIIDVLSGVLDAGDLDRLMEVRIDGKEIVIDLTFAAPLGEVIEQPNGPVVAKHETSGNEVLGEVPTVGTQDAARSSLDDAAPQSDDQSATETEPLKGGPLARKAALICQQGAFAVFLRSEFGIAHDADPVLALKKLCGVTSRAHLDHDFEAGENFKRIETAYDLWMRG